MRSAVMLADDAAGLVAQTITALVAALPDGWTAQRPGLLLAFSGSAYAPFNTLLATDRSVDAADVVALLASMRYTGLPYSVRLREPQREALFPILEASGLHFSETSTAMVREELDAVPFAEPEWLALVATAGPQHREAHATLLAESFDMPATLARQLVAAPALNRHSYLAYCDGEPVGCALGVQQGDVLALCHVAVRPSHRDRGVGTALGSRLLAAASTVGARWALGLAPAAGEGLCRRLGFRPVDHWHVWVSAR
jgi:GNAT superfamily N-acetyltransferase